MKQIVNRKRYSVQIHVNDLGFVFTAMCKAINRWPVVSMFSIGLAPILGRWKKELRKDLWKL